MACDFTGGANRYLSVASAPASGSPMTIAGWLYPTSTTSQIVVCAIGVNNLSHRNQLFMQGGGALQAVAVGASATDQPSAASNLTVNEWNHCSGVYTSATNRTAYRNGTAGTAGTTNIGAQNAANELLINARNNGSSIGLISQFSIIAEVGVWNVALTADEIASLSKGMTCDKVRPQSLVFYAPLVRNLIDVKGGLTITNNNTATVANHPRVYA